MKPPITILLSPWQGNLESELKALLQRRPRFDRLRIAVAFVKDSGVARIVADLEAFKLSGGRVEVVVGIDHAATSKEGLERLLVVTPDVFILDDRRQGHTFHPKLYMLDAEEEAVAFVGSNNLTAGGISQNFELAVRFDLKLTVATEKAQYEALEQAYNTMLAYAFRLNPSWLHYYDQTGQLLDEASASWVVRRAPAAPGDPPLEPPGEFPVMPVFPGNPRARDSSATTPRNPRGSALPPPLASRPSMPPHTGTLVINLTFRDISRAGKKSPDVQITKEVRDADAEFWQWPARYPNNECYFHMHVNMPAEAARIVNIRVYANTGKSPTGRPRSDEFRLNCGLIRVQAVEGDLLRIDKVAPELPYEYEITVIPQADIDGSPNPQHAELIAIMTKVRSVISNKRYVYL